MCKYSLFKIDKYLERVFLERKDRELRVFFKYFN